MLSKKSKKGFTLIELIVVIAILGILAAVLIPKFGGFTDKAKQQQALVDAKQIATAVDSIIAEGSTYSPGAVFKMANVDGVTVSALNVVTYTTGHVFTPDADIATNGYFTYTVGGHTAGRDSSNGAVHIIN